MHAKNIFLESSTLIGLRRIGNTQNGFAWVDGTLLGDYTNWANGEPSDDGLEDCVVLNGVPTQWIDYSCRGTFWFVCQRKTSK